MREPSSHGIRGSSSKAGRGCLLALLALAGTFGARDAGADPIARYVRDTGNINFVSTGGTLRNSATNTCTLNTTSTQTLSGIPANTTIRNAYLYWGGSGATAAYNDTTVTLNGTPVTATRTFARTWNNGTNYPFFGDFANVTSIVNAANGNATYTFGGLTVNTGAPHSGNSTCAGGWALIVIYQSATERLRAINVFDGLDYFYGSALTLTPDGFRVPPANIDGRIAVFTLDGDPGNSTTLNGVDEALRFNGTLLDDGLVPAGSVPTVQQFDGTINTSGVATSYGVDVDQYDISGLLNPGATSGTTLYSAGSDLVLLMAQVVSATSDPAVNLGVTMSHAGNFVAGGTGQYTITVSNGAGMEREDNTVTVTDTLPAGFTFSAGTGTGWNCSAAGQVVTCTHAPILNSGASFPALTLTVNVLETATASVDHTVTVSSPSYDFDTANNTATDTTTVVFPNLSTSTKSVVDLNGGEAQPGDTLRYTISLIESAGFPTAGASITDHIPANTTFASIVSIPAGATSSFTPAPGGNNNKGLITVTGITVPASSTRTVIFDVTVDNVSPGALINNQATVTNPNGPDATPSAPPITVLPSFLPGPGATKQLYLWSGVAPLRLTRTRPSGTPATVAINGNNQSQTFTMNVPLQSALTLNNVNFNVTLLMNRTGTSGNDNRTITVTLRKTIGAVTTDITTTAQTISPMAATPTAYTFTLTPPAVLAMPVGTVFSLVVNNNSGGNNQRNIALSPSSGGLYSRIDLNSATVVNVDSIQTWNAAYNGGAQQASFYPGATVFVRATISDPFGSFDISDARLWITDTATPTPGNPVSNLQMTPVGPTCGANNSATCVFQGQYTLPSTPTPPLGTWNIRVRGIEGVEGVFDEGLDSFVVAYPQPAVTMVKSSMLLTSPVPGNPKRIPQSVVRYDVTVTNSGPGSVDANTLVITDPIPANTAMYVSTASGNPVVFVNGTGSTVSGLTYNYATNVQYSITGASGPWGYTPQPDANGFDPAVRAVRIAPGGTMSAAGAGNPTFTIQFRVRIN
jgi:uncharacterized repeat protein (TIGR01451 family)